MKIEISKAEYETMLQLLEITDWVLNAHRTERDPRMQKLWELEQKLFSYAEAMGYGDMVESHAGEIMPTREFEDTISVMPFIDEFENDTFWTALIDRLGWRDLAEEVDEDAFERMPLSERFERKAPLDRKYSDEFEARGLQNLRLVEESEGEA